MWGFAQSVMDPGPLGEDKWMCGRGLTSSYKALCSFKVTFLILLGSGAACRKVPEPSIN